MLVIVGGSGSGKSTLEKNLSEKYGLRKVVSYTTRPMRPGEIHGIDYRYVANYEFEEMDAKGVFVEISNYRGWCYGIAKEDLEEDSILVLTPAGLRKLKEYNKTLDEQFNIISLYLDVDRKSRLISLLKRDKDIDESIRRNQTDVGLLDGVEDEVDCVIKNYEYRFDEEQVMLITKRALEEHLKGSHKKYYEE